VIAVAAGRWHSLAVKSDGTVRGWGWNDYGQTSVPPGLTNVVAVAAGGAHSVALRSDGRVIVWGGESTYGQRNVPSTLTNAVAISAGNVHSLALTRDGRVVAWGYNDWGQGVVPYSITNAVAVACGNAFNVVLRRDGAVVAWGYNDAGGETNVPTGLTNVVNIAAGGFHGLALVGHAPPSILSPPRSQSIIAGTQVAFGVYDKGTLPLHYQWQYNGADLAQATNGTFSLTNTQPSHAGNYAVVVSNAYGAATSSVASLTVRYSLTARVTGSGTVLRSPLQASYAPDSQVMLTAQPTTGYALLSWSGDASGSANPLTLTMTSNRTVTANFVSTAASIGIQGQGSVTKSPDQPFYNLGDSVTLAAAAGRWHDFTRWGDGVTANPRTIIIGSNNAYTAIFSPTTAVETLTFSNVSRIAPVGMPAILIDGQFVPSGSITRRGLTRIEIFSTFSEAEGTVFYTLDGSVPGLFSTIYDSPFVLQRSAVLRAAAWDGNFSSAWETDPITIVLEPLYSLIDSTAGGGSIVVSPANAHYLSNAVVTLEAVPNPGWSFLHWLGDASGTNATNYVVITRDKCVEAVFVTPLNTVTAGSGSIGIDPNAGVYPYGTLVRLTALPPAGPCVCVVGQRRQRHGQSVALCRDEFESDRVRCVCAAQCGAIRAHGRDGRHGAQ
jgi:hypothetical protein